MNLRNFFVELKRRNVYRAAVGYCAVSWLLIQIATQVFPFFDISNSTVRLIVVASIIGFPIAMLLAWLYELTPGGLVREEEVDPAMRKGIGRTMNFVIIGALLLVIALLIYQRLPFRTQAGDEIPQKSIAVLPFGNLSDDPENAFFAEGIQDDILTNLAKIRDLRVISRTSVERYREHKGEQNLREIARSLGVAHVLEGTVRRAGNRVAVNVQLIDARQDRHLWAHRYDRTIEDSLGLEGELAQEIADSLSAKLTPEERARVERKPTDNADAWTLYLRARQLEHKPDALLQDLRTAEQLFEQAVKLDPKFALAYAMLAITRAEIFHYHEPIELWKEKARSAAEAALRLEPNLSEVHQALGSCYFWFDGDYEAALREFAKAAELAPNDSTVALAIAAIHRRQGHWGEALAGFEAAQKLDPQDPNVVRNILITNTAMRRWLPAAKAAARWRALAPDSVAAKIQTGYVEFWWKGDAKALRQILATVPAGVDPDGVVTSCRWEGAMLERNFPLAAKILEASPLTEVDYTNGGATPKTFLSGFTALARGDQAKAQSDLTAAAAAFEKAVQESPESAERHANLGLCYAFLGRRDDALREGRMAVELKPQTKDAFDGAQMKCYLALIYVRLGELNLAFPLVEELLHTSGAVDSVCYSITASDLKMRWEWEPLRQDARFAGLIAQAK
ncbi:MAG: FlgO family outer membrane protein [Verrucomicrobiota bacterium]|nr:FlgO family outer membrane protein [Verrucomicrobiota bacterium]